jgi:hypothetical protein
MRAMTQAHITFPLKDFFEKYGNACLNNNIQYVLPLSLNGFLQTTGFISGLMDVTMYTP